MEFREVKQEGEAGPGTKPTTAKRSSPVPIDAGLLRGVRVSLDAVLGRVGMTAEELMSLENGAIVTLESSLADHVELYLDDALVARGEIVAVGDNFGVRIVEIAPRQ